MPVMKMRMVVLMMIIIMNAEEATGLMSAPFVPHPSTWKTESRVLTASALCK